MLDTQDCPVIHEWESAREEGTLGFRLVDGGQDHGFWLEARFRAEGDEWGPWDEEDLDGPGFDLLAELPAILAAERVAMADENRRLQDLLDRQERDLVTLREHIGTWKRETLAKLRQELIVEELAAAQGWDGFAEALARVFPEGKED